jgi:hypothetical protein
LPAFHVRPRYLAAIGGQRVPNVIGFLEFAASTAPDEALIRAGIESVRASPPSSRPPPSLRLSAIHPSAEAVQFECRLSTNE